MTCNLLLLTSTHPYSHVCHLPHPSSACTSACVFEAAGTGMFYVSHQKGIAQPLGDPAFCPGMGNWAGALLVRTVDGGRWHWQLLRNPGVARLFWGTTGWQVASSHETAVRSGKHHVTESQLGGRLLHPPSAWELQLPLAKGRKKKNSTFSAALSDRLLLLPSKIIPCWGFVLPKFVQIPMQPKTSCLLNSVLNPEYATVQLSDLMQQ